MPFVHEAKGIRQVGVADAVAPVPNDELGHGLGSVRGELLLVGGPHGVDCSVEEWKKK